MSRTHLIPTVTTLPSSAIVTVWRRYAPWQIEMRLALAQGQWCCHEILVSRDPYQTPLKFRLNGAFADAVAAAHAAEAGARRWIDECGAAPKRNDAATGKNAAGSVSASN